MKRQPPVAAAGFAPGVPQDGANPAGGAQRVPPEVVAVRTLEMRVGRLRVDVLQTISTPARPAAEIRSVIERWEACRKAHADCAPTPQTQATLETLGQLIEDIGNRIPDLRQMLKDAEAREPGQGGEKKGAGF